MGGTLFPPCIYLGPNCDRGNEGRGDLPQKIHCMYCYTQCPQPCSRPPDPHLCQRYPDTHRQVRGSLLWCHCSFLLGPGAQVSVVPSESLFPSPGSSMVGLMTTSSKRAYAIPKSAAPRAPVPAADHHRPAPPQQTLKHSCLSLCGVPGSWCIYGLFDPLSVSGGNGVWF